MSWNPPSIRGKIWKSDCFHTFIDFCSSRVLYGAPFFQTHPTNRPFGIAQTTSRIFPLLPPPTTSILRASIIHTFFRYVTQAWAHRKILLLWIDDMPSWKILSLEEEIFVKYFPSTGISAIWMGKFFSSAESLLASFITNARDFIDMRVVLNWVWILWRYNRRKLCWVKKSGRIFQIELNYESVNQLKSWVGWMGWERIVKNINGRLTFLKKYIFLQK
jgi:hypothetical protein